MEKGVRKNPYKKDREGGDLLHKLRAMLLLSCFILVGTMSFAQKGNYTLVLKNASLTQVMDFVKQRSDYYFLYKDNDIKNTKGINVNVKNGTIKQLLDQALAGKNISYSIENKTITLRKNNVTSQKAEKKIVVMFGKVIDKAGVPIPGASVFVKGTQNGMSTDIDGKFEITSLPTSKPIVVSFIGMQTREIPLKNGEYNVVLVDDEEVLEEVVVTGYQTISKERATGSFEVVTPNKLKDNLEVNVLDRLEGQVAGLVNYNGAASIRGVSTLRGEQSPLLVVDGLPYEGKLENINPAIIQNITVLKDAAAASIYGARAANGVIVVSTKKGAMDGKVHIAYDGGIRITPKPNFGCLDLMSSSELVGLQQYGSPFLRQKYNRLNPRRSVNPVNYLLLKHKAGLLTDAELEAGLNTYRNLDNRSQLEDFYLRKGILHHHNLSLAGGTEKNRYFASVNYKGNNKRVQEANDQSIGFTLRDNIKFLDWLTGDLAVSGNFSKERRDKEMDKYYKFYTGEASYTMLKDSNGNPLPVPKYKSQMELDRLVNLGLMNETYSPITNKGEETILNKEEYFRVKLGLNMKLLEGLDLDVMYQTERTVLKNRELYGKNSYKVRNMINNAAKYDTENKKYTLNVPEGGQLQEKRGNSTSYTLRMQLNFLKELNKHYITAIAGAERRQIKNSLTSSYYMGYDDTSLGYKPLNALDMSSIRGTEALNGYFGWSSTKYNYLLAGENRYVSFYSNASYTYDNKYGITGSIRVDQSNLFGTDPKYQYRPLWSIGGSWSVGQEDFMQDYDWVDMLKLRVTYGIGGNVPKDAGPFLTLYAPGYLPWVDDFYAQIKNPPNPTLRWEKTATSNFGVDFSLFKSKLNGSIDIYKKHTTDLLAYREADPTLGWKKLLLNYGEMQNKGVEVSLNSQLKFGDLYWTPALAFSFNKNEILDVKDEPNTVFGFTRENVQTSGYPVGAIFSLRYAGLSPENGRPLYYNSKGEKVKQIKDLDDIVYSGTKIPKYNASFRNNLSYKNFDLSFLFVYYGGHVMRGDKVGYLSSAPTTNLNRDALNVWKQPGDEKNPNAVPAYTGGRISRNATHQWLVTDDNVVKADYLKLRNVALSYTLDKELVPQLPLESVRFTFQVQNLFTWTANDKDYDPEAMSNYGYGYGRRNLSIPTIYTFGVSMNF